MRITVMQAVATWLLETYRGRVALKVIEWCSFFLGMLLAAFIAFELEHRVLPVIKDWKLDYIERQGDTWVVGGTMRKLRACELVSTSVLAVPKMPLAPRQLIYQIKPEEILGGHIPTGTATWGPWTMAIPKLLDAHRAEISSIDIVGYHRCHAFWVTETFYGSIRMEDIP